MEEKVQHFKPKLHEIQDKTITITRELHKKVTTITNKIDLSDLPNKYSIDGKEIIIIREFSNNGPNIIELLIHLYEERERNKRKGG